MKNVGYIISRVNAVVLIERVVIGEGGGNSILLPFQSFDEININSGEHSLIIDNAGLELPGVQ